MPDPSKVKVQFNIHIPWLFKEFIADKAMTDRVSQNQLAVDALLKVYGREYDEFERSYIRAQTKQAGATS